MRLIVASLALVAFLASFGAAAAQEMMKAPMNLAEGAMAPSPSMMMPMGMGMPMDPQSATMPSPMRRSRALLELAEQLAQRAAAPSSQFVQQIPAASPAPFFAASPAGGVVSLEELQRQDAASKPQIAASVYDAISKNSQYSDLKQLVDKAGLAGELGPQFSGTVFAPNNAAFDALAKAGGPSMSALLGGSPSDLKKILLFHVSPRKIEQDVELSPGSTIDTKLSGAKLASVLAPSGKGVNLKPASYAGKQVGPAGADVYAGNASIFPIDAVLVPGPEDIKAAV